MGMPATSIDGTDVEAVWKAAGKSLKRARKGKGPSFIHATCTHPEGHFLGDPLVNIARHPVKEIKKVAGPMIKSAIHLQGASIMKRSGSLATITALVGKSAREQLFSGKDPLIRLRRQLKKENGRLEKLEDALIHKNQAIFNRALTAC